MCCVGESKHKSKHGKGSSEQLRTPRFPLAALAVYVRFIAVGSNADPVKSKSVGRSANAAIVSVSGEVALVELPSLASVSSVAATPTLNTIDNVAFASVIRADPDRMAAPGMVGWNLKYPPGSLGRYDEPSKCAHVSIKWQRLLATD